MRYTSLVLMIALCGTVRAQDLRVAITPNRPTGSNVASWPLSVGVPFAAGQCKDVGDLIVVDAGNTPVASQVTKTGSWDDGSVRWALADFHADLTKKYFLTRGTRTAQPDDIKIQSSDDGVTVTTGGATYSFRRGQACFDQLQLDGQPLLRDAGDAFYVIDSQGRRGLMKGRTLEVELSGPRHTVVRAEGDYLTDAGQRNAAGVIYYHFFAGIPWVKISHKLIVTEQTLDLWFRDIGIELPLALSGKLTASFNDDYAAASSAFSTPVTADAVTMVQPTFPHFGKSDSKFVIRAKDELRSGAAAGDWTDVSSESTGLAVQVPAFAEQFPKAFRIGADKLVIKLWAGEETGTELDFRTPQIVQNYFGHDWIPADHKLVQTSNTACGTARTHDIWLYPHTGSLTPQTVAQFGATKDEIYASVDPIHIAQTGAMDPILPHDPQQLPAIESAIEDFFLKHVVIPERIFPDTGYIAWGKNPYTSAMWELKNGRWYPSLHRLSRNLDYNLKRGMWVLYARSGQRMYREFARRHTRFLADFYISNFDCPTKPLGWIVQGEPWDSPAFWGAAPEETIRKGERAEYVGYLSTLGMGTSEDVIQFVYDYFLSGDFHSRDAATMYKDAFIKEMNFDVEKFLKIFPTYVLLRPMASAFELDRDKRLYDYGHTVLNRVVGDGSDVVNNDIPQNYVKSGEIWAGFYHYYVSTGDELALQPLIRAAQRYYRTNRIELIYRGSGMPQAFAAAFEQSNDPAYLAWLKQAIDDYAAMPGSLAQRGIDPQQVTQSFDKPWGHVGAITEASPVTIGVPVALRALAQYDKPLPKVPLAVKHTPTARTFLLFKKDSPEPARIDLYVNNFGDRQIEPKLLDANNRPLPLTIELREEHRVSKPRGDANWQHMFNTFYGTYGTHGFYRLRVDVPPGVYQIDAGDDVAISVLYSDLDQFLQVAPQGLLLGSSRTSYFPVPAGTAAVELFAHRPVQILNPSGQAVTLESLGAGRYRFATTGAAGAWCIQPATDPFVHNTPFTKVESFVRFLNIPTVIALSDAKRLFDVNPAAFTPPAAIDLPESKEPSFVAGRFDQAALIPRGHAIEVKDLPGEAPHARGTIELWYRPLWSVTDLHMEKPHFAEQQQELLSFDPILIRHMVQPIDAGRSSSYVRSKLDIHLMRDKGAISHPVTLFPQAGKWYHLAVTWNVDGENSDVEVFVNGRRQTYDDYRGGIPHTLKPEELAPPASRLRFGSAVHYGYATMPGQMFDDIRISRAVRYRDDFDPPSKPFDIDEQTYLMMSLDGSAEAVLGEARMPGQWITTDRLRK